MIISAQNAHKIYRRHLVIKKQEKERAYTVKKRRLEEIKGNTSKMEETKEKAKSQEEKLIE